MIEATYIRINVNVAFIIPPVFFSPDLAKKRGVSIIWLGLSID